MLITWSDARAARTTVSTVTDNGVVRERINHAVRADQYAVSGVAIDHVLIDRRSGNADVTRIAGAHAVPAVQRDLTIPNKHVRKIRACGIGENAVRRVVGKHTTSCRYSRAGSCVQAISIADQGNVIQRYLDSICCSACNRIDAIEGVVPNNTISDV